MTTMYSVGWQLDSEGREVMYIVYEMATLNKEDPIRIQKGLNGFLIPEI